MFGILSDTLMTATRTGKNGSGRHSGQDSTAKRR